MFFKQHHITRPTVTTANALIHTGQELCKELTAKALDSTDTKNAVEILMRIFKDHASREEVAADGQRVRRAVAQAWRKKAEEDMTAKHQRVPDEDKLFEGTGATDPLTDDTESVVGEGILCEDDGLRMCGLQVTYCMMHITVQFLTGLSFVGFGIRYYVSKLFLPIGENTKEFVRNVPGV